MTTIIASAIISAITAKIVATYYFKEVDGYVREIKDFLRDAAIPIAGGIIGAFIGMGIAILLGIL